MSNEGLYEDKNNDVWFSDQGFISEEDITNWVQNTGRSIGYVIVKKRSRTSKIGFVRKIVMMCERSGDYRGKNPSSKNSSSKKINCPFELVCFYNHPDKLWKLRIKCASHNHAPANHFEGHAYAMRFNEEEKEVVENLSQFRLNPRNILSTIKNLFPNNVSSLKNVYNEIQRSNIENEMGLGKMDVLINVLNELGFVYKMNTNKETNEVEDLFFCHPDSLAIWQTFPQVLLMDATYNTNKYKMPLLHMVGVTSTKSTFSIAFVCMDREKEENYAWALRQLNSVIDEKCSPSVIVTDRQLALMNACNNVFPEATQLLCRWHISQNIFKKCRPFLTIQKWGKFLNMWDKLVNSITKEQYWQCYSLIQQFLMDNEKQRILDYINKYWLEPYKHMFVSAWYDRKNYGENTTNRVEGQHGHLKNLLNTTQSSLHRLVKEIETTIKIQHTEIKAKLEKSKTQIKHKLNVPQFKYLIGVVSSYALDMIITELERLNSYTYMSIENCGCFLRKTHGLPCAHELSYYFSNGESIQVDEIDIFWRTLEIRAFINVEPFYYHPSFNIYEPLVRKETRGRPSLKSKKMVTQHDSMPPQECRRHSVSSYTPVMFDLNVETPIEDEWRSCSSRFNYDFSNQTLAQDTFQPYTEFNFQDEPFMQNAYNNLFMEPSYPIISQAPTTFTYPFIDQIPSVFRPFIRKINDVIGDGNCGFRSVAVALGRHENEYRSIRQELYEELMSGKYNDIFSDDFGMIQRTIAEDRAWMIMPDTGALIVERYKCIVNFISANGSSTCFPLFTPPPRTPNYPEMTILQVNNNHFIHLEMEENHPMPTIIPLWTHYKKHVAGWDVLYEHRLNLYIQNTHVSRDFQDLSTPSM